MACSPVIALTGGSTPGMRYRHMYQEVEDFAAWDGVTKANLRVDSVQRFPDLLRQAFRVATSSAPGPGPRDIRGSHAQTRDEEAGLEPRSAERISPCRDGRPAPGPA